MKPDLLLLNSIGLTACEVLASECSDINTLQVLPGSNFMVNEGCFYRSHDPAELDPKELFSAWSRQFYEKDGRHWAGLCRHMSKLAQEKYKAKPHAQLFLSSLKEAEKTGKPLGYFDYIHFFADSFFKSQRDSSSNLSKTTAVFGRNFIINVNFQKPSSVSHAVLSWCNQPATWLTMINRRLTWNGHKALYFYLAHMLVIRWYEIQHPEKACSIYLEDYLKKPSIIEESLLKLGLKDATLSASNTSKEDRGFIQISKAMLESLVDQSADYTRVYKDTVIFQLCSSLNTWSDAFLKDSANLNLLKTFLNYWDTTSHTNFDFLSPLELEIAEAANKICQFSAKPNYAFQFYHDLNDLDSATYDSPSTKAKHALGSLEEIIGLPCFPYFVRAAIAYLEQVALVYMKQPHSYRSLRNSYLYKKLKSPEHQLLIRHLQLGERMDRLEKTLDETVLCAAQRDTHHKYLIKPSEIDS